MVNNLSGIFNKIFFISGHALLSILILLQSLSFQISVPEMVLCIGDDGHFMLEQEGTDIHCDHPNDPLLLDQLAWSDFHEDDCLDIPLKQHLEIADNKQKSHKRILLSYRSFRSETNNQLINSDRKIFNSSVNNFSPPELDALKGIVLLI